MYSFPPTAEAFSDDANKTDDGKFASAPFDVRYNADVILRSCDRVQFHVSSSILVAASPFFAGMFEVPQPRADEQSLQDGLPVIDVSEDSKTLETLLRICYPINKPKLERTLTEMESALRASLKYEMELPTTVLIEYLEARVNKHAMRIWALACRLQIESLARLAGEELKARGKLDFSLIGDMNGVSAGDYLRLRSYSHGSLISQRFVPFNTHPPYTHAISDPQAEEKILFPALPTAPFAPDVVCRSRDGGEVFAHLTVLAFSSTVLRDKIVRLQEVEAFQNRSSSFMFPVLDFDEDTETLALLISLCYPIGMDPHKKAELPSSPSKLMPLLVAVENHGLASAVQLQMRTAFTDVARRSPLLSYCAAIQAGHASCAKEAARFTLAEDIEWVYLHTFEAMPALAYHRLLQYHERARQLARSKMTDILRPLAPHWSRAPRVDAAGGNGTRAEAAPAATAAALTSAANPGADKGKSLKRQGLHGGPSAVSWGPWLWRRLRRLSPGLQVRPGSDLPSLQRLFSEATTGDEHVWCHTCQTAARDMLDVNEELEQFVFELDNIMLVI